MKLSAKTIITAVCLFVACMIVSNTIIVNNVRTKMQTLVHERAEKNAKYFMTEIDKWLKEYSVTVQGGVDFCKTVNTKDNTDLIYEYLGSITNSSDVVSDFYIGVDTGFLYDGSGWVPDEGWSCLDRGWYTGALESDGLFFGSPYVDANTGDLTVPISIKCNFADGQEGVLSMDLNTTKLMSKVPELINENLSGDAYAVVGTSDDTVIYHPDSGF